MPAPVIGIDCRYISARPSGIGEVVQALVDHAPILAPELRFLLLKHPSAPARLSEADNVEEIVVPVPPNGPLTMWFLPHIADLSKVDLFHATSNIMPAGLKMPCVTTIHDIMWVARPELCSPRFWAWGETRFFQHGILRALDRSAAIATVSEATRAAIAEFDPDAAKRVHVTPSGVASDFRPMSADADALRRMGLRPGKRYVLTVGQYAPYKNHEGAVAAFAAAFGDRDDIDLVLVQRLDQATDGLKAGALALGLGDRVRFLSSLTREQLIKLYGSAAALLHPSFYEGFGNPLAEAMACGCPVVTSDRSSMPEVTGGAALLANPYDVDSMAAQLRRVVDDQRLAARMSQQGLARAAEFSWRNFAAANVSIYRETLAKGHRTTAPELQPINPLANAQAAQAAGRRSVVPR